MPKQRCDTDYSGRAFPCRGFLVPSAPRSSGAPGCGVRSRSTSLCRVPPSTLNCAALKNTGSRGSAAQSAIKRSEGEPRSELADARPRGTIHILPSDLSKSRHLSLAGQVPRIGDGVADGCVRTTQAMTIENVEHLEFKAESMRPSGPNASALFSPKGPALDFGAAGTGCTRSHRHCRTSIMIPD